MTGEAAVRRGRKFDQVLEGAREVFLRSGFDGASVDDIARQARVSKATLYSYFPDKRLLFLEVARAECRAQAERAVEIFDRPGAPEVILRDAARWMTTFLLSDLTQRVFRVMVAETERFPEVGRAFYESGPAQVRARIRAYLVAATARGELAVEDPDLAADQFAELCKADLYPRMVFGLARHFTDIEIARVVDGAVAMFLARYAV